MLLVLQAGTLRLCSEHPRDQEQAWRHPVIALQTSSTHTHNTDKVPVLLPTGTGGSKERRGERGWGLGGGSHGKPRGRVFGGCGTCSPCAAGVSSSLTSAAQLSAPLLLLWSTSTPLGGGGVVPLKGRCRPQNCLRWCPLQLKWSRGPKRPPLGPLMGDLCFAIQVWDLSPFQGLGKGRKSWRRRRHLSSWAVHLPSPVGSSSPARREGAASSPSASPGWELLCPRLQGVVMGFLLAGGSYQPHLCFS